MGGGLSICNRTEGPLHVGFGHVGPLYYENHLQPEHCMVRNNIGNTHMTLYTRYAHHSNEFSDGECIACVGTVALGTILGVATVGTLATIAAPVVFGTATLAAGTAHVAAGAITATDVGLTAALAHVNGLNEEVYKKTFKQQHIYTNCKAWDITGGKWERNKVQPDGTIIDQMGALDRYVHNGRHYNCHPEDGSKSYTIRLHKRSQLTFGTAADGPEGPPSIDGGGSARTFVSSRFSEGNSTIGLADSYKGLFDTLPGLIESRLELDPTGEGGVVTVNDRVTVNGKQVDLTATFDDKLSPCAVEGCLTAAAMEIAGSCFLDPTDPVCKSVDWQSDHCSIRYDHVGLVPAPV